MRRHPFRLLAVLLTLGGCLSLSGELQAAAANDALPFESCAAVDATPDGVALKRRITRWPGAMTPVLDYVDLLSSNNCWSAAQVMVNRARAVHAKLHRPDSFRSRRLRSTRVKVRRGLAAAPMPSPKAAPAVEAVVAQPSAAPTRDFTQERCLQEFDLSACDQALQRSPDQLALQLARVQALLNEDSSASALQAIKATAQQHSENAEVTTLLASATIARKLQVDRCLRDNVPNAMQQCEKARIPGDTTDFLLRRRMGYLLREIGDFSEAFLAFSDAHWQRPADVGVAGALINLAPRLPFKSKQTLTTLGSALLNFKRFSEAESALNEALSLDPGHEPAARLLSEAVEQRFERVADQGSAFGTATPAPLGSTVAGEPATPVIIQPRRSNPEPLTAVVERSPQTTSQPSSQSAPQPSAEAYANAIIDGQSY